MAWHTASFKTTKFVTICSMIPRDFHLFGRRNIGTCEVVWVDSAVADHLTEMERDMEVGDAKIKNLRMSVNSSQENRPEGL
jgi:hypothetical protein